MHPRHPRWPWHYSPRFSSRFLAQERSIASLRAGLESMSTTRASLQEELGSDIHETLSADDQVEMDRLNQTIQDLTGENKQALKERVRVRDVTSPAVCILYVVYAVFSSWRAKRVGLKTSYTTTSIASANAWSKIFKRSRRKKVTRGLILCATNCPSCHSGWMTSTTD